MRHAVLPPLTGALFAVLLGTLSTHGAAQGPRQVFGGFPEGCAAIDHVVLQFDPDAAEAWWPTCRDLLRELPPQVRVTVALEGPEQQQHLLSLLESEDLGRPDIVITGGQPTIWARDRMVAVGNGRRVELRTPHPDSVPEGYEGDLATATALAWQLPDHEAVATAVPFEGGDIACSRALAFVGWNLITGASTDHDTSLGVARFEELLGRTVVPIGAPEPPHDHLDMYLTVLDDHTVVLGDPAAGAQLLEELGEQADPGLELPDFDTWTVAAQHAVLDRYDRVLAELGERGLRVLRVPILHGEDGQVMTWNNALVERRDGIRRVYLPTYGVPLLDDAAARAFCAAGCRVLPIEVTGVAASGGTIRCVTNVVAWSESPAARIGAQTLRRNTTRRPAPRRPLLLGRRANQPR